MRSVFTDWLADCRTTWRRDLTLIALVALASTMAACGGTTAAPHCTSTCYAVAGFYQKGVDFGPTLPTGVDVAMTIANLTCDGTCTNAGGNVENYVLLGDSHLDNWVKIGYTSLTQFQTLANGSTWDYYSAEAINGNLVAYLFFGAGNATDLTQDVNFTVQDYMFGGQDHYDVTYSAPSGYATHLYNPFGTGTDFEPGAAEAGEVLHGSQGEAADSAFYTGFYYNPYVQISVPSGAPSPANFPLFLNGMGHVESDKPPYGVWIGFEGVSNAWFQTWCCKTV